MWLEYSVKGNVKIMGQGVMGMALVTMVWAARDKHCLLSQQMRVCVQRAVPGLV